MAREMKAITTTRRECHHNSSTSTFAIFGMIHKASYSIENISYSNSRLDLDDKAPTCFEYQE